MPAYRATLKLRTPNEDGKKLNFRSPIVLKELVKHIKDHNSIKEKQIRIHSVSEHSIEVILFASDVYKDGRDFIPLSNILRENQWVEKYSSNKNLLTATHFYEDTEIDYKVFRDLPILPKEYDYIWGELVDKIMDKQQTIDLLNALFVLAETKHLTPETTQEKYANCLYKVKEALYEAFN